MKILLLILFTFSTIFADENSIEKKIFESFFTALSPSHKPVVYVDTKKESLLIPSQKFTLTSQCQKADIVVMTKSSLPLECQGKTVFGTRYRHLKQPYVIGAFFWQKGRPHIVFLQERLDKAHIVLPPSLQEYAE